MSGLMNLDLPLLSTDHPSVCGGVLVDYWLAGVHLSIKPHSSSLLLAAGKRLTGYAIVGMRCRMSRRILPFIAPQLWEKKPPVASLWSIRQAAAPLHCVTANTLAVWPYQRAGFREHQTFGTGLGIFDLDRPDVADEFLYLVLAMISLRWYSFVIVLLKVWPAASRACP